MTPDARSRPVANPPTAPPRSPRRLRWRRRWTAWLVFTASALVALTLFAAANFVQVELRLLVWTGDVRLAWAVLVAGALGFALGLLVPRRRR